MAKKTGGLNAVRRLGKRIANARLSAVLTMRVRFLLLMFAILSLTLAFMLRDDWFVKEFATYDWARDLGV